MRWWWWWLLLLRYLRLEWHCVRLFLGYLCWSAQIEMHVVFCIKPISILIKLKIRFFKNSSWVGQKKNHLFIFKAKIMFWCDCNPFEAMSCINIQTISLKNSCYHEFTKILTGAKCSEDKEICLQISSMEWRLAFIIEKDRTQSSTLKEKSLKSNLQSQWNDGCEKSVEHNEFWWILSNY